MFGNRERYDDEKIAWIRLARTDGIGPIRMAQLVNRFGSAVNAIEAFPTLQAFQNFKLPSKSIIEDEIMEVQLHKAKHVCLYEEAYPESLRMIADPPPVLTVRGDVSLLHERAVGIVGTRNASINGRKITAQLAQDISKQDYVIISGMARGIDSAAHEATLYVKQKTIAVLAGGVDHIYPKENVKLYEQILEQGAIISEYPWGMQPNAKLFPQRNRIVSGLSLGIIVVEAALRSGSLITARLASEQGREVFAVPGSPLDGRAAGPNKLLQDGAKLVTCANDVLEDIANMAPRPMLRHVREKTEAFDHEESDDLFDAVGDGADHVKDASNQNDHASIEDRLLHVMSTTPIGVDELIRALDAPASAVQAGLMMLEIEQKVERLHGNRVALCA